METVEEWPRPLQVAPNVEVILLDGDRASASEFGEMLFTHLRGRLIILT